MDPITIKAPFVGSDGRPLIEPGAFYLDGNYVLRVNSWNALAGVTLTIRCRMIRASDGELVDSSWDHTPNTNRTKATNDFPLPQGFILNVTVFASAGTPLIGQTFVQIQLARGLTGATLLLATMLQDYVTSVQALAYPGSPIRASVDGRGAIRTITGSAPGAGGNISETVPTGARWELLTFAAELVTSVAAGARAISLYSGAGGATSLWQPTAAGTQGPGLTGYYRWMAGVQNQTLIIPNAYNQPLPINLQLFAGQLIQTSVSGGDAADQWGAPRYIVREWMEAAA